MSPLRNKSLKDFNTFGIAATASHLISFSTVDELKQALVIPTQKRMILGGGSNLLFTQDFDGVVLKNEIKGISVINETPDYVTVTFGAGENWHDCVLHSINQGWGGIENLALIPGTVGAAPMQNIGAYGVEIKEVFHTLSAVNVKTQQIKVFNKEECHFGYRESIFKNTLKDQFIITHVTLLLTKRDHKLNTSYGAIKSTLNKKGIGNPTIKDISEAVISIRKSKLPDPSEIGNAGSFFKNPTIDKLEFEALKLNYPDMPGYVISQNEVKVPAGWLIEQCGWKGLRRGAIGVHENQALVLVNYGGGGGSEIKTLAEDIRASVIERFGIELFTEVNII